SLHVHITLAPLFLLTSRPTTRSSPFPYTTLFRSHLDRPAGAIPAQAIPSPAGLRRGCRGELQRADRHCHFRPTVFSDHLPVRGRDRKSTRLNSSHVKISYAVFCLKKKKKEANDRQ